MTCVRARSSLWISSTRGKPRWPPDVGTTLDAPGSIPGAFLCRAGQHRNCRQGLLVAVHLVEIDQRTPTILVGGDLAFTDQLVERGVRPAAVLAGLLD